MSRDEVVAKIAELPGVGQSKAEKLYDAGYTSLDKLRDASEEDLVEVEGIGPKIAEAIIQGLQEMEAPEATEDQEIQVVEAGEAAEPAPSAEEDEVEIVEDDEAAYRVKQKPDLPEDLERDLARREAIRKNRPRFRRQQHWQFKKLKDVWRAPKGLRGKQRLGRRYRPSRVKVGYGSPRATRGLHPSGFEEVLVHNPQDLEGIDPKTQAARVGGSVGGRKREAIETRAEELGIRVLNPRRD